MDQVTLLHGAERQYECVSIPIVLAIIAVILGSYSLLANDTNGFNIIDAPATDTDAIKFLRDHSC